MHGRSVWKIRNALPKGVHLKDPAPGERRRGNNAMVSSKVEIMNAFQKWKAIKCLEVMLTLMNALQKWRDIKCLEVMLTLLNALQK